MADVCETEKQASEKKKPKRKRTKALIKNVGDQMEFYFSDANLHKDRFIKQEINKNKDGFIDVDIFLKFNKIKAVTEDINMLCKAIKKSDKLKLNEDGTKVKRIKPLVEYDAAEVDSRTVYVECLPHSVDHDWMKKVFSECGIINYISLPKYKTTGDSKGFGFVEFEDKISAESACQLLNNPPIEIYNRTGRFPKSNKQLDQLKKQGIVEEMSAESTNTEINERKRRRTDDEVFDEDGDHVTEAKKLKQADNAIEQRGDKHKLSDTSVRSDEESSGSRCKKKKKRKKSRKSLESNKTDDESEVTDSSLHYPETKTEVIESAHAEQTRTKTKVENSSDAEGKNRKRKRTVEEEDQIDVSVPLKQKRKTEDTSSESEQLSDSKSLKKSRNSVEFSDPVAQTIKTETSNCKKKKRRKKKKTDVKEAEVLHLRVIPKKEWLKLRKEYLSVQKSNMAELKKKLHVQQQKENEPSDVIKGDNKSKHIDFTPSVIVKVESTECMNRKTLRELFTDDIQIAYIDLIDGAKSGYIRCKNPESAKTVINRNINQYEFELLSGDEESKYWNKLELDRNNKLNNKNKTKKRGIQKLIDKAQKVNSQRLEKQHVYFED